MLQEGVGVGAEMALALGLCCFFNTHLHHGAELVFFSLVQMLNIKIKSATRGLKQGSTSFCKMAPKFTSFLAIALYISYSTSSFLPGESELTFPLLPRQNNCPGYYSDECDCSDPYVTVCDVGGIEWFPDLPADPSPPTQPPPSSTEVSNVPVPTDPGCDKKTAEDVTKDFVVTTGDVVDRKDLVYRIRQGKLNIGGEGR